MFCVNCGAENPSFGSYCYQCGIRLYVPTSKPVQSIQQKTEMEVLAEILSSDPGTGACHECGLKDHLHRWSVGVAKTLAVKRDWSGPVASVLVTGASLALAPLTGFGAVCWKGMDKTTQYLVIRTEIVLCRRCASMYLKPGDSEKLKEKVYEIHPWHEALQHIGFDRWMDSDELRLLKTR